MLAGVEWNDSFDWPDENIPYIKTLALHWNFIPSCTYCWCLANWPFELAWWSHSLQLHRNFIPWCIPLCFCKMILCRFIVFTFPAWVLLSFIYWLMVSSETTLWSCLEITFTAFTSLLHVMFVVVELDHTLKLLGGHILCMGSIPFMYCLLLSIWINIWSWLVTTFSAYLGVCFSELDITKDILEIQTF